MTIPSNFPRVPTMLASQIMLGSLNGTSRSLLDLQVQMASGKRVNRPSDDALATSAITILDDLIERRDQRLRNLSHAESLLNHVDSAIGEATDLLIEAKGVALSQVGIGSDADTRESQAHVIDAMLSELVAIGNRQMLDIHLFGGVATADAPLEELLGGLRYVGQGEGMVTDLGLSREITVTAAGDEVFGSLSARVRGERDLDPGITADTRLVDLDGAAGFGMRLGSISVDVNGTDLVVDLTGADRIQDIVDELEAAIQTVDPTSTVRIDPTLGHALEIVPGGGTTITVSDLSGQQTALDLGLVGVFPPGGVGGDLNARITPTTTLASLTGLTLPLGSVRIGNGNQSRDVDLSSAQTVQDLINKIEATQLGVRMEIDRDGSRLNVRNEISGAAMSIAEVGGGLSATELGIRSLDGATRLEDFNDGVGVEIRSGSVDPISGLPDPAADLDLRVALKDGRTFDVDLAGAETVQDVVDQLNAAAVAAGVTVPAEFQAGLVADGNGIALTDATVGATTTVSALNGSRAAEQLGFLGSTTGATLAGEDRATVAVDSVFSHLMALRDALRGNDERGITVAGEKLDADITRLARSRGEFGVYSRRVADAVTREEDTRIQEIALRSEVQDLDFTEAAIRFATLQQQLQAGLQTASRVTSLTLLDFLG